MMFKYFWFITHNIWYIIKLNNISDKCQALKNCDTSSECTTLFLNEIVRNHYMEIMAAEFWLMKIFVLYLEKYFYLYYFLLL